MVKLGKVKLLITLCLVVIVGFISISLLMPSLKQGNNSIFGRNVYNSNEAIGKIAEPQYVMSFPHDHSSHELFDIEWWYLTANLKDEQGKPYGLQWTLFRFRNPSAAPTNKAHGLQTDALSWHNNQMYMAHASVHSLQQHWFTEKFARGGVGNAYVAESPFTLNIDEWSWINTSNTSSLLPARLTFSAQNKHSPNSKLTANFSMRQTGPLVKHGVNGYSVKSTAGHASHYYSAPFIDIQGEIQIGNDDGNKQNIKLKGNAWYDHEWTSQLLDDNTLGWDWLSLHLDNGDKLMAFRMRLSDQLDYITGSYIDKSGVQTTLEPNDLSLQPLSITTVGTMKLPLQWKLTVPSKGVDIRISSIKDEQFNEALIPYYEGMVVVEGSHGGEGFIELTGYSANY